MNPSKKRNEEKAKKLLLESEDWEKGRRGAEPEAAPIEAEAVLDARLDLQMISLRLPTEIIKELKKEAREYGQRYQPYIRKLLIDHVNNRATVEERLVSLEKIVGGRS